METSPENGASLCRHAIFLCRERQRVWLSIPIGNITHVSCQETLNVGLSEGDAISMGVNAIAGMVDNMAPL
jgi:6-phosphogluconate dehydrogenase (decarboxylating)